MRLGRRGDASTSHSQENPSRLVLSAGPEGGLRAHCGLPPWRSAPRNGIPVAIEIQHTTISEREIEARVAAYARARIPQIWIPILRDEHCPSSWDDRVIDRYPPRPFERWLHAYMPTPVWYYNPRSFSLWRGVFSPCLLWKEESTWYEEGGEERSEGGFDYESSRWDSRLTADCVAPHSSKRCPRNRPRPP